MTDAQMTDARANNALVTDALAGDSANAGALAIDVRGLTKRFGSRTVVDHIFRNPHDRRLEGTFEYPLPTGASPSYFAMFLGQTRDTVPPRQIAEHGLHSLTKIHAQIARLVMGK